MEEPITPSLKQLFTAEQVRTRLSPELHHSGEELNESDWVRIADRMEALARLFWRISHRRALEEMNSASANRENR